MDLSGHQANIEVVYSLKIGVIRLRKLVKSMHFTVHRVKLNCR